MAEKFRKISAAFPARRSAKKQKAAGLPAASASRAAGPLSAVLFSVRKFDNGVMTDELTERDVPDLEYA